MFKLGRYPPQKTQEPNFFIDTAKVQSLGKAYSEVGAIRIWRDQFETGEAIPGNSFR